MLKSCQIVQCGSMQVRDLLTTEHEQQLKRTKQPGPATSLSKDAIMVDAVVSTIGFPLVGGPAGTMEGGRQADVAKAILTAKNIPYVVAAPLLIQVSAANSLEARPGGLDMVDWMLCKQTDYHDRCTWCQRAPTRLCCGMNCNVTPQTLLQICSEDA